LIVELLEYVSFNSSKYRVEKTTVVRA